MTGLVEVFSAWFRTFGYASRSDATVEGRSGSHHQVPLLVERDMRRIAIYAWLHTEPPTRPFFDAVRAARSDADLDDALVLCLSATNDINRAQLLRDRIHVWDHRRIVQELGEAVLAETCPELVPRTDPLSLRSARMSEAILETAPTPPPAASAPPTIPNPVPTIAVAPTPAPPAAAEKQAPSELIVPPAFGILDAVMQHPPAAAAPAAPTPSAPTTETTVRTEKPILKLHVSKLLALSLVRTKIKRVDRVQLRLTPYRVYDYEARLLVDGSLDSQSRTGRMAVDAALKRVQEWTTPLETGPLDAEGADVDEKRIRVDAETAEQSLRQELVKLVTRNVVLEEDGDEWSVVVKKKVELSPDDITLTPQGLFFLPVWRVTGKEGHVEIDATTGTILDEEVLVERTDAQLI